MSPLGSVCYAAFAASSIAILKEVNSRVTEPYMDEPFHVPQAQAYCNGDFGYWDPKITTPPGLYVLSLILKRVFMLKCNLAMLRLTPLLTLVALPLVLTRLICHHKRERPPPSPITPVPEAVVLSLFPIAWFFGFLYYTEVPSLVFVVLSVVAASQNRHWLSALLGAISCTFRQTNIVWVLYAYASSQLVYLRFRRDPPDGKPRPKLHDPPALAASPVDLVKSAFSAPLIVLDILPNFVPYALVLAGFAAFAIWNGGIVLGDKSNHVPVFHVPQLYYFVGFSTLLGWPALVSGPGGISGLARGVLLRMFGSRR
ncbi:hypothetical protein NM688_g8727 [Phlebia brevispora]|uniref:Uncharacterized protein n=1 Tax=Phlebia brevispora TaxID=194682 RepID=A0ACC1RRB8_9APHY|nr:hypothetical protein NM688_g8727 [Phlebia brevispora]